MSNNMMKRIIRVIIVIVLLIGFLVTGVVVGASMNEDSAVENDVVLYPKNDMKINEVSKNTVVITTLNFEDAFKEIEKSAQNIKKAEK